jgi:uncharacterized protein YjbI with pentapeptide repeats
MHTDEYMASLKLTFTQLFKRIIFPILIRVLSFSALVFSVYFFHYAFFDINDWELQDADYVTRVIENAALQLQSPTQIVKLSFNVVALLFGIFGFIIPVIRALRGLVPHWYKSLTTHYANPLKKSIKFFLEGADIIRKGSMWVLLYSLVIYMVYDRENQLIDAAWHTIDRAQNSWGDLGRREALNTLIDYDVNIIGVDLRRAQLSYLNFDSEHDDTWKQPDRAMLDLVDFENTDLSFSSFPCVFMRQANLNGAKLYGVRFTGADLRDTQFLRSDFGGKINDIHLKPFTDFSFSDLREADLSDAEQQDHISADPYGQYLSSTSKAGAWFIGTDLRGAKLGRKVLGIQNENDTQAFEFALENLKLYAQWDNHTVFPAEIASALNQWQSSGINDAQQSQRWQRLYAIYMATFGEERSARLQSYLTLHNKAQNINKGESTSISDQVCRKSVPI